MAIQAEAWKRIYPGLCDRLRKSGVPDGFTDAKAVLARELTAEEMMEAPQALLDWLKRIVTQVTPLSTETYYLVFQLAEEASILDGLGLLENEARRSEILEALTVAFSSQRAWLRDDIRRAPFLSGQWPFPDLLKA